MIETRFFERAGLGIGSVEDGEVGKPSVCTVSRIFFVVAYYFLYGLNDVFRFVSFIFRFEEGDFVAAFLRCPEFFVALIGVFGNDAPGGVEYGLRGAIILIERDDGGFGVIFLEVEDIADVCLAPAVYGLVVVADREEIAVPLGEEVDECVLRVIGILVLVHHDVSEEVSVVFECFGVRAEELYGEPQEVVKVERVITPEFFLIAAIGFCDEFFVVTAGLGFENEFVEELVFGSGNSVEEGARMNVLGVDFERFHGALHKCELVVAVENGKRGFVSQGGDVFAEDARANAVEGADVR